MLDLVAALQLKGAMSTIFVTFSRSNFSFVMEFEYFVAKTVHRTWMNMVVC